MCKDKKFPSFLDSYYWIPQDDSLFTGLLYCGILFGTSILHISNSNRPKDREIGIEDVVRGIYYVTLRYRNNLQQQIELMILPPGINLLNYGWMPGVEGSVRLNYSWTFSKLIKLQK